jgi:kynureninase
MNSLTVNMHLLLASFYRPTRERFRIVMEDGAFPSDRYAVMGQLRLHGIHPADGLVLARPRAGEETLRTDDLEALMAQHHERLALVWLPGVQYVTGQALAIEPLTAAGHAAGAMVGWDLAHAAGNLPLRLHDWDVDFAVWCTYKYLNAGPGAVGQAFVHARWASDPVIVRLAGWWGNDPLTRLGVAFDFEPRPDAGAWQVSNPPILALAPLRASLEIFDEAGIEGLRARSLRLVGYLQRLIDAIEGVETVTPRAEYERGQMLCLRVPERSRAVQAALAARGVILDFREPDVFRLALAPLYNTYAEAWRVASILRDVVGAGAGP